MTYEEFIDFVKSKCTYETIYEDSEGRLILVIDLLGAYGMVNKAKQEWVAERNKLPVNLTVDELIDLEHKHLRHEDLVQAIKAKLKQKNA